MFLSFSQPVAAYRLYLGWENRENSIAACVQGQPKEMLIILIKDFLSDINF